MVGALQNTATAREARRRSTIVDAVKPLTAIFVYLGSRLETLSPTDPILWIGAAVLIGLLVLTHYFQRRWSATPRGTVRQSEVDT